MPAPSSPEEITGDRNVPAAPRVSHDRPAVAGGTPVRSPSNPLVFGAPAIGEEEIAGVVDCLRRRWIGLGPKVDEFERAFASYKNAPYAVAVSSGTAGLHLALAALGIGPGDEVVAPTMTFCSTVHSVIHVGAQPVLVDCDRRTLNIDPTQCARRITSRTKAVIVVHMCGRCCEMASIMEVAQRHGLHVIEDCAHAIESVWRGVPTGLIGNVGCFSFYATKNLTTADGGMVVTHSSELAERIRRLSLHGMTADAWHRLTDTISYEVIEAGFKYNMTDIAASIGLAQLAKVERHWKQREFLWRRYTQRLADLPLTLPPPPERDTRHAYHLFTPLLDLRQLRASRDSVLEALRAENIGAGIHYVPVHAQPYYRKRFGLRNASFPNASFVGQRTISPPLAGDMTPADVDDVCTALARILHYYSKV